MSVTRHERHLYVTGLRTIKSVLVSNVGLLLILATGIVWRSSALFLVLVLYVSLIEWCRSQGRVSVDENRGHLRAVAPLLGDVQFELDTFQSAIISAPGSSSRAWEALLILFAGLLLIPEVYHFTSGITVRSFNVVIAVMLLVFAFWMHRRRDYKELELWFGEHSDWRRHVWPRRKVTFRGREEVLQQLKRQVEAAVGQGGE